jgi:hypothetical protein
VVRPLDAGLIVGREALIDEVDFRLNRPDRRADRHGRLVSWPERHMPA